MKGSDVSDAAREHAREFLQMISGVEWPDDDAACSIPRSGVVQLLAWYGEVRSDGKPPRPLRRIDEHRGAHEPSQGVRREG